MLGFSAAAQFMSAPGQSYSVSAFNKPMQDGLGLSETSLSLAYGVATIISGLVLPMTGRVVDRFGARVVLPIVASLLTGACWVMSEVGSLPLLYVGFTLIRCLGQGAMWLIGTWIVGEWFKRRRGFATALSGLGSSISVMVFPVLNLWLIETYGWERSWQILGIIVAATVIIPSALFLRDRPEDIGLLPDGDETTSATDQVEPDNAVRSVTPTEVSWTLPEVLRDLTFWKLLSTGVCSGMIGTGLVFHQQEVLAAHGISKGLAMSLISFQALIGTVAAFAAGSLTDRYPAEKLLSAAMLMLAIGVGIVCFMPVWWLVFGFAVLNGLHGAIQRTAGTVVWINYYGRANQGVIRGAAMSAMILAAAVGPMPLALAKDNLGTYFPALLAFTIIPLLSAFLVFSAKQPTKSGDHERTPE
jgi:MFS family permease